MKTKRVANLGNPFSIFNSVIALELTQEFENRKLFKVTDGADTFECLQNNRFVSVDKNVVIYDFV